MYLQILLFVTKAHHNILITVLRKVQKKYSLVLCLQKIQGQATILHMNEFFHEDDHRPYLTPWKRKNFLQSYKKVTLPTFYIL